MLVLFRLRRCLQFRTRTMLLVTALVAMFAWLLSWERRDYEHNRSFKHGLYIEDPGPIALFADEAALQKFEQNASYYYSASRQTSTQRSQQQR